MMKRAILLFFVIQALLLPEALAVTPRDAFVNAPRSVIASIDSITRLDMLDYYASGSNVASRNAFGGDVQVKFLTDESITVGTSRSSEVSIFLMPSRRDTMLLVINTLALPASDSYATVYSSRWQPLAQNAQLPEHNDLSLWLLPGTSDDISDIENLIPFVSATYNFSGDRLTIVNTLSKLLPKEDYEKVKGSIKPSLTYRWTGKKWKLE